MAQVATTAVRGWVRPRRSAKDASQRGAYWQHVVLSRVALVRNDLQNARDRGSRDDDAWARIEVLLATAEHAASRPGSRIRLWLSGSAVNRAFVNLHAAQVLLAKHLPDEQVDEQLRSAMTRVRTTMPGTAKRREDLEDRYAEAENANDGGMLKRWVLEKALDWSYATTDAQYARLRSFRNILSGVSIAVLCFSIGLAVMGLLWPDTLQLCFAGATSQVCPTGNVPTPKDALVIEVLGAAGGALAAVLAISKMQGTSTPYSVPLALAMLKLPFGALSAILGLVLIHGRFVPGLTDLDTSGQILAYAIVLGIAQQAVTALVDRRGQELLAGIPGKRTASTSSAVTNSAAEAVRRSPA
jgi:hypothetical protein